MERLAPRRSSLRTDGQKRPARETGARGSRRRGGDVQALLASGEKSAPLAVKCPATFRCDDATLGARTVRFRFRLLLVLVFAVTAPLVHAAPPLDEKGLAAFIKKHAGDAISRAQFESDDEHQVRLKQLERRFAVDHVSVTHDETRTAYRYDIETRTLTLFLRTYTVEHQRLFPTASDALYPLLVVAQQSSKRHYLGSTRAGGIVAVDGFRTESWAAVLFGTDPLNRGQPLATVQLQLPPKEAKALAERVVWRMHGVLLRDFPEKRKPEVDSNLAKWSLDHWNVQRPTFSNPTDASHHTVLVPAILTSAQLIDPKTRRVLGGEKFFDWPLDGK